MVQWNSEVDAKLFVCTLKQMSSSINYPQLAADMASFGIEVTPKAITHRIAKLKAEANKGGTGASTPVSTPKKGPTPRTPKTPASAKKGGGGTFVGASARNKRKHADTDSSNGDDSEGGDPDGDLGVKKKERAKKNIKLEKTDQDEDDMAAELALFSAAADAAHEDEENQPEEV